MHNQVRPGGGVGDERAEARLAQLSEHGFAIRAAPGRPRPADLNCGRDPGTARDCGTGRTDYKSMLPASARPVRTDF
jgi:hypothetical protein